MDFKNVKLILKKKKKCKIDYDMFDCFRVKLIIFSELILFEAKIDSF